MDIIKANEVLSRYYSQNDLNSIYRTEGFGGSETDTIRKHRFNGELLTKEARSEKDDVKKKELYDAAKAFEELAKKEEWHR